MNASNAETPGSGDEQALSRRQFVRVTVGSMVAATATALAPHELEAQNPGSDEPFPSDGPNAPMGAGKGIFPGRVVWIRDEKATPWDGLTGRWWEPQNIHQPTLDSMFSRSLCALTGRDTQEQAWDALFRHYNATHGRGARGYQLGERIAIKINLNNTYSGYKDADNNIDASTHSIRTLLAELTSKGQVPAGDITVYDASPGGHRRAIPDRIYLPLHAEFPDVQWVDCQGLQGRDEPHWIPKAISYSSPETGLGDALPKCCVESVYLINLALLKGHEMSGVTLCGKNHFGSIQFPHKDHGKYVTPGRRPMNAQNGLVDLMGSPNLGGKTFLYLIEGLYGTQTNVGHVTPRDRWKRLFNGQWSASLFMSQDPVAIDSVGLDFLCSEFREELGYSGSKNFPKGAIRHCDHYLHEAARGSNAQLGNYRPNSLEIGSLGVHEHWNNPQDKQYSRNLNPAAKGIELIRLT